MVDKKTDKKKEEPKEKAEEKVEGTKAEEEKSVETPKVEEKKSEVKKSSKKEEEKPELEREYVIPIRKRILKVPRYKRAKRAIRTIQAFLAKHMKVENRDIRKVKIDMWLNEEMWFRGIKKPLTKIKVKAKKIKGIVYAELAEIPEVVQFKINKQKKLKERLASIGMKKPKVSKVKEEKPLEEKIEEQEKEKAVAEADSKANKMEAKVMKHETGGSHAKKTTPRRQSLKK
jgi:large subunit ribosomal protein L31e